MSGDPIRVLRIIARLNVGGPALHTAALCGLDVARFRTMIVHGALGPAEADMSDLVRHTSAEVVFVSELGRAVRPWHDVVAFVKVLRLMFQFRPHVIHTHTAKAGALGRVAAAVYRVGLGRRPCRVVHTFHGHVFDGYFSSFQSRAVVVIERALARLSDCILTVSESLRVDLVQRFRIAPDAKIRVVPLGLDLEPFVSATRNVALREELGIPASACVVACVGRLVPVKNHRLLLRAAALMAERGVGDSIVFLIVGGGELRAELEREATALGVAKQTRFLGWRRDLVDLYAASDIAVLTSVNEGTPITLIEAMAAGLPTVATEVGGVPDVVEHNLTGLLVPTGSVEALAEALIALAADPQRRTALGQAGRARALQRYTRRRLIADVEALYEELLSSRWKGRHALVR